MLYVYKLILWSKNSLQNLSLHFSFTKQSCMEIYTYNCDNSNQYAANQRWINQTVDVIPSYSFPSDWFNSEGRARSKSCSAIAVFKPQSCPIKFRNEYLLLVTCNAELPDVYNFFTCCQCFAMKIWPNEMFGNSVKSWCSDWAWVPN